MSNSDNKLMKLVTARATKGQPVLELGCSHGGLVSRLIKNGYNALGIEGRPKYGRGAHCLNGDIRELDKILGSRKFEAIYARGVFNQPAQIAYLFAERDLSVTYAMAINPNAKKEIGDYIPEQIKLMLEQTYKHLTDGGCAILLENVTILDRLGFERTTAEEIGYRIIQFEPPLAILQHP